MMIQLSRLDRREPQMTSSVCISTTVLQRPFAPSPFPRDSIAAVMARNLIMNGGCAVRTPPAELCVFPHADSAREPVFCLSSIYRSVQLSELNHYNTIYHTPFFSCSKAKSCQKPVLAAEMHSICPSPSLFPRRMHMITALPARPDTPASPGARRRRGAHR